MPQVQETLKEMKKVLGSLTIGLGNFVVGHWKVMQECNPNCLIFVYASVSGLKVATLIDSNVAHNL